MSHSPRVTIKWMVDEDTPIEGVKGIDSETVHVDDLVRWARKRRRAIRRDIQRGYDMLDRQAAEEAAERQA